MGVEALIAELKDKIAVEGPGSLSTLLEKATEYLELLQRSQEYEQQHGVS
jgi:hypothetical protein